MKKLLHVGCANRYYEGFINIDKMSGWKGRRYKLDLKMNLGDSPWPFENESIDGIIGMHVFHQLYWRELVIAFKEAFRVLKKEGVLRMGVPMVEIEDRSLEYLLGWNNVNLFNFDLLKRVLIDRIGFSKIEKKDYQDSKIEEFKKIDNRQDRGTWYIELIK